MIRLATSNARPVAHKVGGIWFFRFGPIGFSIWYSRKRKPKPRTQVVAARLVA